MHDLRCGMHDPGPTVSRALPASADTALHPYCTALYCQAMIDEAHRLGLYVLLDVVHSHMSNNADDGLAGTGNTVVQAVQGVVQDCGVCFIWGQAKLSWAVLVHRVAGRR